MKSLLLGFKENKVHGYLARSIHVAMIWCIGVLRHESGKIASGITVRGDGGVASEGRFVGAPKFHFWDKCTMPLTNINSHRLSNASSGLCIIFIYLRWSFISHLGVKRAK